jgi:hypothetical protein
MKPLTISPDQAVPLSVVTANAGNTALTFLSWDTEGGDAARINLLRPGQAVHVEARRDGEWKPAVAHFRVAPQQGGFDLTISGAPFADAQALRLVFPFSPRASATTIIPSAYAANGNFALPAIVSSPLCGPMVVRGPAGLRLTSTFEGSRSEQLPAGQRSEGSRSEEWVDWRIELPAQELAAGLTLTFRPLHLAPPAGLQDMQRWSRARRAWFNVWQVSADWGDPSRPFSAPAGVLANNVISDPVSACLFIYADSALLTPQLAEGISVLPALAHTLDWFLDNRTLESGQVISYYDHLTFLDSNPSLLIAAWDYVEASGDEKWLTARLERLEQVADYLATRDVDGDGIVEAVSSGDAGTLHEPARPANAYDCVNFGHKDAYSNALIYRAWRCMADLEKRLHRKAAAAEYSVLADKLKAAYFNAFYNPENGWLIGWISGDGARHDYGFPFLNCMAIDYGLVTAGQGREILARLDRKMKEAGFTRFDTGVPCCLMPVRREDYLQGLAGFGVPQREDGSDTFKQYCNGAVFPGDGFRWAVAHYAVGQQREGDIALDEMLERTGHGDIANGGFSCGVVDHFPDGSEFFTWDGEPSGYEGMLSHAWYFVQAVALREPELRARLYRPLDSMP